MPFHMATPLVPFVMFNQKLPVIRDGRFGSKVGQSGPKWDKSGAFSDQIVYHQL